MWFSAAKMGQMALNLLVNRCLQEYNYNMVFTQSLKDQSGLLDGFSWPNDVSLLNCGKSRA